MEFVFILAVRLVDLFRLREVGVLEDDDDDRILIRIIFERLFIEIIS